MEEKDVKMVKKPNGKLSKITLSELLVYKEATLMVYNYYDNLAKSNMGEYDDFKKEDYEKARKETDKYAILTNAIFEEIKKRVDQIL